MRFIVALPTIEKRYVNSLAYHAKRAASLDSITKEPIITAEPENKRIVLEIDEADKSFWLGFLSGRNFVMANPNLCEDD